MSNMKTDTKMNYLIFVLKSTFAYFPTRVSHLFSVRRGQRLTRIILYMVVICCCSLASCQLLYIWENALQPRVICCWQFCPVRFAKPPPEFFFFFVSFYCTFAYPVGHISIFPLPFLSAASTHYTTKFVLSLGRGPVSCPQFKTFSNNTHNAAIWSI